MAITQVTTYLFFDGKAEEAIRLYEEALGAKVESPDKPGERAVMRYGDSMKCPEATKNRVMHAYLQLGAGAIMLSDTFQPAAEKGESARNASVALNFDDPDDMRRRFDALAAAGGTVVEAIHDAFWGDKFGVVDDAVGVRWLFTSPIETS